MLRLHHATFRGVWHFVVVSERLPHVARVTSRVRTEVEEFIAAHDFPCVGAKGALSQGQLSVVCSGDLRSSHCDAELIVRLQMFARRVVDEPSESVFFSLMAVFEQTPLLSEFDFESALWARLQALQEIDSQRYGWDPDVSSDPRDPTFSMSFGGRGFYIIGLHPGASRMARRFRHAAIVFNLHCQFERLRQDGRYAKLQEAITARDIALCGSRNPMLTDHGVVSEARQYSGREVDETWECPLRACPVKSL